MLGEGFGCVLACFMVFLVIYATITVIKWLVLLAVASMALLAAFQVLEDWRKAP